MAHHTNGHQGQKAMCGIHRDLQIIASDGHHACSYAIVRREAESSDDGRVSRAHNARALGRLLFALLLQ